ncbi:Cyclin-H [Strongyloides ratti]|uniref:Cyclin-H n=1 Tax=Strongyloides ratti TaxID=34506 RepID=A0A090LL68_STRRB|nr:Cyclin-H [Strongyloides ratti]CEF70460.1 Cyclin-H [Strongyloides ratti]
MYSTSTQKKNWTFSSKEELIAKKKLASEEYYKAYLPTLNEEEKEELLFTIEEQTKYATIIGDFCLDFSDNFLPQFWPTVPWTAFMYYRRFYIKHTIMEYPPKHILLASFYLATKVVEFNVSAEQFVQNCRSGDPDENIKIILTNEPVIMQAMNYNLTIHCPFSAFNGHLLDMEIRMMLNFDVESLRELGNIFFRRCLYTDVGLLYPPSQIALAALKYAFIKKGQNEDIVKEYLSKLLKIDAWNSEPASVLIFEKLLLRIDEIIKFVKTEYSSCNKDGFRELMEKMAKWNARSQVLNVNSESEESEDSDDD